MLPPFRSAMDGPVRIGQVQSYSGNLALPPPITLTVINRPVALQVEAAHNANCPGQIWKS